MTPLAEVLAARIRAGGPMTMADYMAECLTHPRHGYYVTRDPLGAAGDFVTAPEVSQMFGEMVGVWLSQVWAEAGRPSPVRLVELGPGRGTLMADALRAAARTGLAEAADLWLVEVSQVLRAGQAARLPGARWADELSGVPAGAPMLLVANEFLDALPVRQFLASPEGWRERLVGLGPDGLAFGLSEPLPAPAAGGAVSDAAGWREICPAGEALASAIGARIEAEGGAALLIDYGYTSADRPDGPTVQAVRAHARVDALESPGAADLTALVDFDALVRALAPAEVRLATQGAFLAEMGIGLRAESLARARPGEAGTIADALERLTAPEAMGTLFKVAAAVPPGAPPPPGFGVRR